MTEFHMAEINVDESYDGEDFKVVASDLDNRVCLHFTVRGIEIGPGVTEELKMAALILMAEMAPELIRGAFGRVLAAEIRRRAELN